MRAHVIVAALALIVAVLYGVADRTDRGAVDTGKLWKEAHKRAVKEVGK